MDRHYSQRPSWRQRSSAFDRWNTCPRFVATQANKGTTITAETHAAPSAPRQSAPGSESAERLVGAGILIPNEGLELIPGYRLVRLLGEGSYGQVWLATGPGQIEVALKIVQLTTAAGWKEFRAVSWFKRIRHPHLLPITALWLVDGTGAILNDPSCWLMETNESPANSRPVVCVAAMLVAEKSLADLHREFLADGHSGIPVPQLLQYMSEVADALDFLNAPRHDLSSSPVSVAHRDVKPENVLLIGGSAVLCDFGVARMLDEDVTKATCLIGSPAFMSPECAGGERVCPATDQYSLALMYYFLRTGSLPFPDGVSLLEAIHRQRTGNLDLAKIDVAEREPIKKATDVDPRRRYDSCQALVQALRVAVAQPAAAADGGDNRSEPRSSVPEIQRNCRDFLRLLLERLFPTSTLLSLWDEFFEVHDAAIRQFSPTGEISSSSDAFASQVWTRVSRALAQFSAPPISRGKRRWLSQLVRSHTLDMLRRDRRAIAEETLWKNALFASVLRVLRHKLSDTDYRVLRLRTVEAQDLDSVVSSLSLPRNVIVDRHDYALRKLRLGMALFSGESLDCHWTATRVQAIAARLGPQDGNPLVGGSWH